MDTKYDIVYVVKKGPMDSIALRYSLRSLVNIPHRNVFIVGDKPDWVQNVTWIDIRDSLDTSIYKNRLINVQKKLVACCNSNLSDDFILFNDDFFILEKQESIPYYHKGFIPKYKNPNDYQKIVMKTAFLFNKPLHFGVHFPMILNKNKLRNMFIKYGFGFEHRILYGNCYNVTPKKKVRDCKLYNFRPKSGSFLSSNNRLERSESFIEFLNSKLKDTHHEIDILQK